MFVSAVVSCGGRTSGTENATAAISLDGNDAGVVPKTGSVAVWSDYGVNYEPPFMVTTATFGAFSGSARPFLPPSVVKPPSFALGGCTASKAGASPASITSPGAGSISFTLPASGVVDTRTPNDLGLYPPGRISVKLSGGELVQVRSTGGAGLPAFAGDVTFPTPLWGTDAHLLDGIDTTKDLAIPVSRGAPDVQLYVALSPTSGPNDVMGSSFASIVCMWPSDGPTPVIPQAVLAYVPKGSYTLIELTSRRVVKQVGDYAISIYAMGPVLDHMPNTPAALDAEVLFDVELQ